MFELDGDALNANSPGDDWNVLFPTDISPNERAKIFTVDGADPPVDITYFTGGGSKDVRDISQWRHTRTDQAPDKDEIEECPMLSDDVDGAWHIDILGGWSEADTFLYLKYYADEAWRQQWLADFPDYPMPAHDDPPYDRDRHFPKPHQDWPSH